MAKAALSLRRVYVYGFPRVRDLRNPPLPVAQERHVQPITPGNPRCRHRQRVPRYVLHRLQIAVAVDRIRAAVSILPTKYKH